MRRLTSCALAAAIGSLAGAAAAPAATVRDGSPNLRAYRGVPVAVVFFHPL